MDRIASLPRNSRGFSILAVAFFVTLLALQPGFCEQDSALPDTAALEAWGIPVTPIGPIRPFSKVAIGVTFGLLGPGVELATPLSTRTNLRVDSSFFSGSLPIITREGFNVGVNLKVRDIRASYDFFPFYGNFRLSAGVELYNRFNATAGISADPGADFGLGNDDYYSSAKNPLAGTASLVYPTKVAPTLTFGWGNAIPRSGRHVAFPVEIGAAYTGTPKFNLAMNPNSSVCGANGKNCQIVANDPQFKAEVTAVSNEVVNDIKPARFYPILNVGITYKF